MDDPFTDEVVAPQSTLLSSNLTKRSTIFAGLLLLAMLSWVYLISSWLQFFLDAATVDSLIPYVVFGVALASVLSSIAVFWLWLRTHVRLRAIRIIAGWLLCHGIVLIFARASYHPIGFADDLNRLLTFCLLLYLMFWIQGIFLEFWTRVLRLKSIVMQSTRVFKFSTVDLFYFTSLFALLMSEVACIQRSFGGLDVEFVVPSILIGTLMVLLGSLMVMLGFGIFFTKARFRFVMAFLAVAITSPLFCVWMFQQFGAYSQVGYYFQTSALTAAYLLEVLCVFPLIAPTASFARDAAPEPH
jgi:hypothetical protein